jgi:hypothetical protein
MADALGSGYPAAIYPRNNSLGVTIDNFRELARG